MKNLIKKIVVCIVVFSVIVSSMLGDYRIAHGQELSSDVQENFIRYMNTDYPKLLLTNNNYAYMQLVEEIRKNPLDLYLLGMIDKLIETGAEPDKDKYTEVLINLMMTYEQLEAGKLSEQNKLDKLKTLGDYGNDVLEIGVNSISVISGLSESASAMEECVSKAIGYLDVLKENTENYLTALSGLEVIMRDYSLYTDLLFLIEDQADGELRMAARQLKNNMERALEIKLETYSEIGNKNFQNYGQFFFNEILFDALKMSELYEIDARFAGFTDMVGDFVSKVDTLNNSWEIGLLVGMLVGNAAVGGENLINRILEEMAVYDISVIIQRKLLDLSMDTIQKAGNQKLTGQELDSYMAYSKYLMGCRVRGEYCLYRILAKDAGLLTMLRKKSAKEAEEYYEKRLEVIEAINEGLDGIKPIELRKDREKTLISKIKAKTDMKIAKKYYADYDGDGYYELFVVTGPEEGPNQIWFASQSQVKCLMDREWTVYSNSQGICEVDENQKLILFELGAFGSGSISKCYYVVEGKVVEVDDAGEGLSHIEGKDFAKHPSAFDLSKFDGEEYGTGHTWKAYYFWWDGKKFVEYVGRYISKEEFLQYEKASDYVREIERTDYTIDSIIYRENDIINVNISHWKKGETSYTNVNFEVDGKELKLLEAYISEDSDYQTITQTGYGGVYKLRSEDEWE